MTSLYKPLTLPTLEYYLEMACAKFQWNRFRIDGEIDENIRYRFTKEIVAQDIVTQRREETNIFHWKTHTEWAGFEPMRHSPFLSNLGSIKDVNGLMIF